MTPHNYGDWTKIEHYDGRIEWFRGHQFSVMNVDTDSIAHMSHLSSGETVRAFKV